MFRNKVKTRTLKDDIRIASLLSFIAGIVNVAGFLAVQRLTTNVTGHFAFFIDEVYKFNFLQGFLYFLYTFSFFFGSFISNVIIELISRKNELYIYIIPTIIESLILVTIPFFGKILISENPNTVAFILLFAMGLQNSLVTTISKAKVRTTHLTGLFTDLGIEISQIFFYSKKEKLFSSIKLRLIIISFFFLGGVFGGVFYSFMHLYVLTLAGTILLAGTIYDYTKFKLILLKRKYIDR